MRLLNTQNTRVSVHTNHTHKKTLLINYLYQPCRKFLPQTKEWNSTCGAVWKNKKPRSNPTTAISLWGTKPGPVSVDNAQTHCLWFLKGKVFCLISDCFRTKLHCYYYRLSSHIFWKKNLKFWRLNDSPCLKFEYCKVLWRELCASALVEVHHLLNTDKIFVVQTSSCKLCISCWEITPAFI